MHQEKGLDHISLVTVVGAQFLSYIINSIIHYLIVWFKVEINACRGYSHTIWYIIVCLIEMWINSFENLFIYFSRFLIISLFSRNRRDEMAFMMLALKKTLWSGGTQWCVDTLVLPHLAGFLEIFHLVWSNTLTWIHFVVNKSVDKEKIIVLEINGKY